MRRFGKKTVLRAVLCLVAAGALLCTAILPVLAAEPAVSDSTSDNDAQTDSLPVGVDPSTLPSISDMLPGINDLLPGVSGWEDLDTSLITEIAGKMYVLVDPAGEQITVQQLIDAMNSFGIFEGVYVENQQGERADGAALLATGMDVVVPNPMGGDPVRVGLIVLGDATGDGRFTLADLVQAAEAFRTQVVDGILKAALDVNRDGKVNLADLVAIARLVREGLQPA